MRLPADRHSNAIFCPSEYPRSRSPWRKAALSMSLGSADPSESTPIRGTFGGACACHGRGPPPPHPPTPPPPRQQPEPNTPGAEQEVPPHNRTTHVYSASPG